MEQLSNMPVWVQILSVGGFMFSSGVLMTRIPLAPAIILSFCYFFTTKGIPSFCLQRPGLVLGIHIGLFLIFLLVWLLCSGAGDGQIGDGGLGVGLMGMFLQYVSLIIVCIFILITFFPALQKWIELLGSLSVPGWQLLLLIILFVIGIICGFVSFYYCKYHISQFLSVAMIALVTYSVSIITVYTWGKPSGFISLAFNVLLSMFLCWVMLWPTVSNSSIYKNYTKKRAVSDERKRINMSLQSNLSSEQLNDFLVEASFEGDLYAVQELLKKGADVNWRKQHSQVKYYQGTEYHSGTPLFGAVYENHLDIAKHLIKAGANANFKFKDGSSLFGYVRSPEMVKILVEGGAEIKSDKQAIWSVITNQAVNNDQRPKIISELILAGADISHTNEEGKPPLQLAQELEKEELKYNEKSRMEDVIKLLKTYGAKEK